VASYSRNDVTVRISELPQIYSKAPPSGQNYFRSDYKTAKTRITNQRLEIDDKCQCNTNCKPAVGLSICYHRLIPKLPLAAKSTSGSSQVWMLRLLNWQRDTNAIQKPQILPVTTSVGFGPGFFSLYRVSKSFIQYASLFTANQCCRSQNFKNPRKATKISTEIHKLRWYRISTENQQIRIVIAFIFATYKLRCYGYAAYAKVY
jgi:hypothetical protein